MGLFCAHGRLSRADGEIALGDEEIEIR